MAKWVSAPELSDLIGKDAALTLCRAFGGVSQYVPKEAAPDHPFCRFVGLSAMRILCAAYPGEWIVPPNARRPEPQKQAIVKLLEKGHSQRKIALELCVTERWVQMVAGATRGNTQCRLPFI
jgi:DNA-binding NarL/FixJ family response regulator